MRIHIIVGARPNFVKVAPLMRVLRQTSVFEPVLIHTGQHYDANMSGIFFEQLGIEEPTYSFEIGSGSHSEQTAAIMVAYENLCKSDKPDLTIVVGDVNSTMAVSIAAKKLGIKIAHLEAGLRSFDREMPEEINRILTDSIADILWTPSADGSEHLLREGHDEKDISLVGNIMIDTMVYMRGAIEKLSVRKDLGIENTKYGIVTLHRPSNVDNRSKITKICEALITASQDIDLVFPIHPRTRQKLKEFGLFAELENSSILLLEPQGYGEFMNLVFGSFMAITDSGGIQEEATFLKIPCLTLRDNTERPITITAGSNRLISEDELLDAIQATLDLKKEEITVPPLWDGQTAQRVVADLRKRFEV